MMSNERQGQALTLVVVAKDNLKKRLSYMHIHIQIYSKIKRCIYTLYTQYIHRNILHGRYNY